MKRFFLIFTVISMSIILFACSSSQNVKLANNISRTLTNVSDNLSKIETIKNEDLIINQIMPTNENAYTNFDPSVLSNQNLQENIEITVQFPNNINSFKNASSNEVINNQVDQKNINTTYPNDCINPNGYSFGRYGFGYDYTYPGNYPYYYNGFAYNPRFVPNVNTYGLTRSNVNTYYPIRKAKTNNSNVNPTLNASSETLINYFSKVSNLYSVASNVIVNNKQLNQTKEDILNYIKNLSGLVKDLKNSEVEITENQMKSFEYLLDNLNSSVNKLLLARNEIKKELNSIKSLKENYSNNLETLSTKYTSLANCLQTRLTTYTNILNTLNQLETFLRNFEYYDFNFAPTENIQNNVSQNQVNNQTISQNTSNKTTNSNTNKTNAINNTNINKNSNTSTKIIQNNGQRKIFEVERTNNIMPTKPTKKPQKADFLLIEDTPYEKIKSLKEKIENQRKNLPLNITDNTTSNQTQAPKRTKKINNSDMFENDIIILTYEFVNDLARQFR